MSNNYFQFKQFTIRQEHCAMKVCTDACLFGAWAAEKLRSQNAGVKNILDIGAGTGVLSLMLAQKTDAHIDAVEIDEAAAQQATDNFDNSPWKNRLQAVQGDIRKIHFGRKYDLILSNPPFFENNLRSPDTKRNLALHSDRLRLDELISIAAGTIAAEGRFAVLLPYERKEECIDNAVSKGLYLSEAIDVTQSTRHGFFRAMLWFTTIQTEPVHSEMIIRDEDDYYPGFISLLKDYYLNL